MRMVSDPEMEGNQACPVQHGDMAPNGTKAAGSQGQQQKTATRCPRMDVGGTPCGFSTNQTKQDVSSGDNVRGSNQPKTLKLKRYLLSG